MNSEPRPTELLAGHAKVPGACGPMETIETRTAGRDRERLGADGRQEESQVEVSLPAT
jgi:hypothetical protein